MAVVGKISIGRWTIRQACGGEIVDRLTVIVFGTRLVGCGESESSSQHPCPASPVSRRAAEPIVPPTTSERQDHFYVHLHDNSISIDSLL